VIKKDENINDPIIRTIRDHRDFTEYILVLKQILELEEIKDIHKRIDSLEVFYERDLKGHFRFEEDSIFPVIEIKSDDKKALKLIDDLKKDHAGIINDFDNLLKLLKKKDIANKSVLPGSAYNALIAVCDLILKHTALEDDELLPMLREKYLLFQNP
jgi:iron-sulfur cluster repair protein YtfE (RIC family)